MKYTGTIGGYTFKMEKEDTIEVWGDDSGEFPETYIQLSEGTIKEEKDFQKEISFWWMDRVGY